MTWAAIAVGAVSVGTGIYSAKKNAKAQNAQNALAEQQQDLAGALYTDAKPLRYDSQIQLDQFLRTGQVPYATQAPTPNLYGLKDFMNTGTLPTAVQPGARPDVPTYPQVPGGPSVPDLTRARRGILESQFQQARGNTLASADVRGGTLGAALTQLEGQRATGVAGLYDQQLQAQYQQDLARTQQQHSEDLSRTVLQHSEDLGASQSRDALAQRLYGVGLDASQSQASREADLRKALFSAATGVGTQEATGALTGLAGASTSYNNAASTALKEQQLQGQSAQGLGSAAALSQYLKKQSGKGGTKTGSTGVPYDYGLE